MKLNDFWQPQDGACLQLMQISKRTYIVTRREGRSFYPLFKGNIYRCKQYIDEFNSFFDGDNNQTINEYFFSIKEEKS